MSGAHVKLLEDHEDAGDDELRAVLALHDGQVGVLDHARLPGCLSDVFQFNLHIVYTPSALQHLCQYNSKDLSTSGTHGMCCQCTS